MIKNKESLNNILESPWNQYFQKNIRRNCPKVLCKKVALKISQISQENTVTAAYFLIKLKASSLQLCLERGSSTGVILRILRDFKNTNLVEHLRKAASEIYFNREIYIKQ